MNAELWAQVVVVFHAAAERSEEDQERYVDAACKGNAEIKQVVMNMLEEDRRGVSHLGSAVFDVIDQALADIQSDPSFAPPERIGAYARRELLGKGGMGSVWKYCRADTGQPTAIKFLFVHPQDPFSELWRKRFADEMNTLARLRHPHIVSFHDAGVLEDGTPWFVMDYVEEYNSGIRFTEYSRQSGRSMEEKLRLFSSVCEAVLYAHLQGTIHRDLKPSNILIAKDGSPRIVDFGIARQVQDSREWEDATGPTFRLMSQYYAAPEWKHEGQVSVSTDVYSLGVILYEILAGRHPYRKATDSRTSIDDASARNLPEKPSAVARVQTEAGSGVRLSRSAWSDLDKLCLTAMHPDPRERYASVESLIRDISHYLNHEPLEAQRGMFFYRAGKFVRRNRQAVFAAAAMLVLVSSLIAFFMWRLARERNEALAQASRVQHLQEFITDLLQGGDQEAGPAANLPVTEMIDRGVRQADALSNEPAVQADLYQTLGLMSQKLGELDQSESLLKKAIDRRKSLPAADPDGQAMTTLTLAQVRADMGQAREAEQQARQALDEIQRSKPRNKILLGQAELAMGTVMIMAGEQKQAIPMLAQAARDIEAAGGAHSPQLARALGAQADANIYAGNYDAADELGRRALAIDRSIYGENHPHVAEDLGNLAQTQEVRSRYAQAEPLEREALAIMQGWYGPAHPETARKMTTLASTLLYENKADEAKDLLRRALAIQERVYGSDHPKVAYVVNSMGLAALREKNFDDAEKDFRRVADIYRHAYGDGDYRVAVALGNLASVYQAEKRNSQAAEILLDVVQRFTRAFGAGNIQAGMAQVRLGRNLLAERKYTEAATHSLAGYQILSKEMSADAAWVAGARHDLGLAYAGLGDKEKAKQFGFVPAAGAVAARK